MENDRFLNAVKKAEQRIDSQLEICKDILDNEYVNREHLIDSVKIAKDSDRMRKGVENFRDVTDDSLLTEELEKRIDDNLVKLIVRTYFYKYEGATSNNDVSSVRGILDFFSMIFENKPEEELEEFGSDILTASSVNFGKNVMSNRNSYKGKKFDENSLTIV